MNYLKPNLCAPCGGKCCKTIPGCAYPEDFPTKEVLQAALDSGRWCIDWWEGDAREGHTELSKTYYVRPAIKGYEGVRHHPSWGGECTFLGKNGCELSVLDRPTECRSLEPRVNGCYTHNGHGKQSAAVAWLSRANEMQR
jgi:Fe-S-cluster containining protein